MTELTSIGTMKLIPTVADRDTLIASSTGVMAVMRGAVPFVWPPIGVLSSPQPIEERGTITAAQIATNKVVRNLIIPIAPS
jgi:hypothetical protein